MKRLLIAALVIGMTTLVWFIAGQPKEPRYEGRPISYWVNCTPVRGGLTPKTAEAFRAMGSNAIPFLIRELRARDSIIATKARVVAWKLDLNIFQSETAWVRQLRAMVILPSTGPASAAVALDVQSFVDLPFHGSYACRALAHMGSVGIRPLSKALNAPNASTRREARRALVNLSPLNEADADAMVNALSAEFNDPDPQNRRAMAELTGLMRKVPVRIVSVFEEHLDDSDLMTRRIVVTNLHVFAPRARVVPSLRRALTNSDEIVRASATNALNQLRAPLR